MTSIATPVQNPTCRVLLTGGDRWVSLTLSLVAAGGRGGHLTIAEDALVSVTGLDELSAGFTLTNWQGGIISGIRYAFRALKSPARLLCLRALEGRLGSQDVSSLANAAAIATSRLLGREELPLNLEGWTVVSELWPAVRPAGPVQPGNGATAAEPSPVPAEDAGS